MPLAGEITPALRRDENKINNDHQWGLFSTRSTGGLLF